MVSSTPHCCDVWIVINNNVCLKKYSSEEGIKTNIGTVSNQPIEPLNYEFDTNLSQFYILLLSPCHSIPFRYGLKLTTLGMTHNCELPVQQYDILLHVIKFYNFCSQ